MEELSKNHKGRIIVKFLEYVAHLEDEVLLFQGIIEKPGFLFMKSRRKLLVTDKRILFTSKD